MLLHHFYLQSEYNAESRSTAAIQTNLKMNDFYFGQNLKIPSKRQTIA